jgi:hypothetical protein
MRVPLRGHALHAMTDEELLEIIKVEGDAALRITAVFLYRAALCAEVEAAD